MANLRKIAQPRYWMKLKRHPLSADYEDIDGIGWEQFLNDFKEFGNVGNRPVILFEDKVLDCWQLQRASVEYQVKPVYFTIPANMTAEEYVRVANDNRRHEEAERIANRRQRVMRARAEGKSTRVIAEEEKVDPKTVRKDIEASGGDHESPPESDAKETPVNVTGKDGKTYAATQPAKPLCVGCQRRQRVGQKLPKACQQCKELRGEQKPKTEKKAPKKDDSFLDPFGVEIPKKCRDAFADPWIQETITFLRDVEKMIREQRVADGMKRRAKHYPFFVEKDFIDGIGMVMNLLDELTDHLEAHKPAGVCPSCDGKGCADCKLSGLVPKEVHKKLQAKKK